MEWTAQSRRVTLTSCMDEMRQAHNLSHAMWCAMSEDDDTRLNKTNKKTTCTLTCQIVAFHVHCVGLGCHVVIGVGRLIVLCHHAYVIQVFFML